MKLKSIKTKTLLLILPLLLCIVVALAAVVFLSSRSLLLDQMDSGMKTELQSTAQSIQKRIIGHERVPDTIAKSVSGIYSKLTLDDYDSMFKSALNVNSDTFGMGIFFEPNVYNAKTKYMSSYAFRDKNQITVTHDYSDPSYNYPSQEWYKIAMSQKGPVFTDPYKDDLTQAAMVTASAPIFDDKNRFIGVATGDINLNTIQSIVSETKVGDSGWAFLLDKNGTYLAGPDTDKIMKTKLQEDKDASVAALAKIMLAGGETAAYTSSSKGLTHVYYTKLDQTDWVLGIALPDEELVAKINALMMKIALVSAVGVALIVVLIWLYTRSLAAQTNRVNNLAGRLAEGDFTSSIEVKTQDEFGRMTASMNHTSQMLSGMMSKVAGHALHVAATAQQLTASAEQTGAVAESIANTIQDVAAGADTQLRGTQESARSLGELALGIQRIAESSSALFDASQNTSDRAKQGNEMIQEAVRSMSEANRTVSETAAHMNQLRSRSADIGNIIDVITGISMQTNLLSLNAGIEAARAGEHGKGFAVVASEIRKLADQTKQSAEKVSVLIAEMQQVTAAAVQSVENGSKSVHEGTLQVEHAGGAFTGIVAEIGSMVEQIQDMSAVAEEMSAGSQEISATVEDLARISGEATDGAQSVAAASEEQLASMEEVAASAKSLSAMVTELQELIAHFKIGSF